MWELSGIKVNGVSYAGEPKDYTMMYISRKVSYLVSNLHGHKGCLVFTEKGIDIPDELRVSNKFVTCTNPQYEYARYATKFWKQQVQDDRNRGYVLTVDGYYIGKNVSIGDNSYIEPGVLIGHDVKIGRNALLLSGCVIKHAEIGDNFVCNENAVIGNYSFTIAEDTDGNRFRIPSLGNVIIKNNVEVGACNDIARGVCGDTILEDNVKLDGLVHVGHEAHLHKNTEVTAGVIIAGFVEMKEHSYLGINSGIKNRVMLGENCVVGMGANVTRSVNANLTVIGNPARPMKK